MRLDNFQVKGFRAFGDIELKNLCEVNLRNCSTWGEDGLTL
jgi:predicted ATPase